MNIFNKASKLFNTTIIEQEAYLWAMSDKKSKEIQEEFFTELESDDDFT